MAAVVTGHADDAVGHQAARFGIRRVVLPDMHAVTAQFCGQVGTVVQDEGGVMGLHRRAQRVGGAADFIVADILQAQLEAGDIAA